MSNRWITFTAAMAAEILAGRKDMTRRLSVRWKAGDVLGVGEPICRSGSGTTLYSADHAPILGPDGVGWLAWRWKNSGLPGRYMPRDLCRIRLEVLEVREERLQDITDEDIAREGVSLRSLASLLGRAPKGPPSPRSWWAQGWDAINGKTPGANWAENPLVKVTTFRRL